MKLFGIIIVDFDVIDQLLIRHFAFYVCWRKGQTTSVIHKLQESPWLRREVLNTIFIEFGVSMKLVRVIKI
jgi:hypothetical protein